MIISSDLCYFPDSSFDFKPIPRTMSAPSTQKIKGHDGSSAFDAHGGLDTDLIARENQNDQPEQKSADGPFAINVPNYMCKHCNAILTTKIFMELHIKNKHKSAHMDYELKPGNLVTCSLCRVKMFAKNFDKHKTNVHHEYVYVGLASGHQRKCGKVQAVLPESCRNELSSHSHSTRIAEVGPIVYTPYLINVCVRQMF